MKLRLFQIHMIGCQYSTDWVEKKVAPPKQLTVTGAGRSLPLCNYPLYPKYVGGQASDAGSYICARCLNNHEFKQCTSNRIGVVVVLLAWTALCQAQTVSPKRPCAQLLEFSAPGVELSKAEPVPAKTRYRRTVWYRARSTNELGPEGSSLASALN